MAKPAPLAGVRIIECSILGPGAYSVHVDSAEANAPAGEVLIEIYTVPDDFFLSETTPP